MCYKKAVIFHTTAEYHDSSLIVEAIVLTLASSVRLYPWSNMQLGAQGSHATQSLRVACRLCMTEGKEQSLGTRIGLINVSVVLWA